MVRFVVIGANGGTGFQIFAQLARAGKDVIAVVRNPGNASAGLKNLTSVQIEPVRCGLPSMCDGMSA